MPVLRVRLQVDLAASSPRWAISSRSTCNLPPLGGPPIGAGFANKPDDGRYFNRHFNKCAEMANGVRVRATGRRAVRERQSLAQGAEGTRSGRPGVRKERSFAPQRGGWMQIEPKPAIRSVAPAGLLWPDRFR